jgi:hypothetical protein
MTVDIESVAKETDELDEVLNKLKQAKAKKPPEKGSSSPSGEGESAEGKGTGNKSGGTGEKEEGEEGKESRSDRSGAGKEGAKEPDEKDEEDEEVEEGEEGEGSGKGDEKEDEDTEEGEGSGEGEEDEEEPEGDEEGAGIDEEHDSAYEDARKKFEDEVANKDTKPDIDASTKEKIGEIVDKFEPVVHDEEADEFIEHIRKDETPKGDYLQGELSSVVNLPDVREDIKAMLKRVQNISRAPSNSGRLDVRRYIQARLNHADIPVFVNRRLTSLNEGKFLILVDVSGSMWSGMRDYRFKTDFADHVVTRISFEINVGQALQEQLTKMGATVKVFSFGNKLIEGFNDGGGASTEEGLMWVSVYMPYVLQGYTLIFMTDSDIVNGFTDEFRAMTAMQHKRGGGILLWFNDGASVIPDRLKSAWGSIEAIPVFSKETAMLAIKKLMQKLLTIYT